MAKVNSRLLYELVLGRVFFGLIFLGTAAGIATARILGLDATADVVFISILSAIGLAYIGWATLDYHKHK